MRSNPFSLDASPDRFSRVGENLYHLCEIRRSNLGTERGAVLGKRPELPSEFGGGGGELNRPRNLDSSTEKVLDSRSKSRVLAAFAQERPVPKGPNKASIIPTNRTRSGRPKRSRKSDKSDPRPNSPTLGCNARDSCMRAVSDLFGTCSTGDECWTYHSARPVGSSPPLARACPSPQ